MVKFKAGQAILQAEGLLHNGVQPEGILVYDAARIPFVTRSALYTQPHSPS